LAEHPYRDADLHGNICVSDMKFDPYWYRILAAVCAIVFFFALGYEFGLIAAEIRYHFR